MDSVTGKSYRLHEAGELDINVQNRDYVTWKTQRSETERKARMHCRRFAGSLLATYVIPTFYVAVTGAAEPENDLSLFQTPGDLHPSALRHAGVVPVVLVHAVQEPASTCEPCRADSPHQGLARRSWDSEDP